MTHLHAMNPDGHELDRALNWITAHPWLLAAGILCLVHVAWFVLAPRGSGSEQRLGLALYGAYAVLAAVRYAFRARVAAKTVLFVPTVLSLAASALYAVSFLPSVETAAQFRGVTYLITSSNVFLGWGRPDRQLIVW